MAMAKIISILALCLIKYHIDIKAKKADVKSLPSKTHALSSSDQENDSIESTALVLDAGRDSPIITKSTVSVSLILEKTAGSRDIEMVTESKLPTAAVLDKRTSNDVETITISTVPSALVLDQSASKDSETNPESTLLTSLVLDKSTSKDFERVARSTVSTVVVPDKSASKASETATKSKLPTATVLESASHEFEKVTISTVPTPVVLAKSASKHFETATETTLPTPLILSKSASKDFEEVTKSTVRTAVVLDKSKRKDSEKAHESSLPSSLILDKIASNDFEKVSKSTAPTSLVLEKRAGEDSEAITRPTVPNALVPDKSASKILEKVNKSTVLSAMVLNTSGSKDSETVTESYVPTSPILSLSANKDPETVTESFVPTDRVHDKNANRYSETTTNSIINFLADLHAEHCIVYNLCSKRSDNFESDIEDEFDSYYEPCCLPCSCDPTCYKSRSCCADFEEYINNQTEENLMTQTIMTLSGNGTLSDSSTDSEGKLASPAEYTIDVYEHIRQRNDCVQPQIRRNSVSIYNGKSFLMVASCRALANGSQDLVNQCRLSDYTQDDVEANVPVTSLRSNITYVNRYCLYCNEKNIDNDEYVSWEPKLICQDYTRMKFPPIREFTDLTMFVKTDTDVNCNLLFLPADRIKSSLTECVRSDIYVCNVTGEWSSYSASLEAACLMPLWSPVQASVYTYQMGLNLMFKNIACYLCNAAFSQLNEKCLRKSYFTDYQHSSATLQGNLSAPDSIPGSKRLQSLLGGGHRTDNDSGIENECTEDQFFDIHTNTCRILLCPNNYLQMEGTCVPAFGVLHRVGIGLNLRQRFHSDVTISQIRNTNRLFYFSVENFFTGENITACYASAWAKMLNGEHIDYIYHETVFWANSPSSFHDILSSVTLNLHRPEPFGLFSDNRRNPIPYEVTFDTSVVSTRSWPVTYLDTADGNELISLQNSANTNTYCGMYVSIGNTSYCSRVQLSPNEFTMGKNKLRLYNAILNRGEFDMTSDGKVFVCVDKYIAVKMADRGSGPRDKGYQFTGKSDSGSNANLVFIIISVSTVGIIVALAFVTRFCKHYRKTSQR